MDEVKARAIVLEYFTKPDFDRVHFLYRKGKESEMPPRIFAQYIMAAWEYYFSKLNYKIQESRGWGNDIKDYGLPLLTESNGQFSDHLYFSQMPIFLDGIKQYINERCNLLPIVTDGKTYHYHFDQSEIPENLIWEFIKWFNPDPKFQLTDKALKIWETDYNNFIESRPNFGPLLLAKGIEYAEICLKHCKEYEPKDLHQIDSLERRINAAQKMAGVGPVPASNKTAIQPKHKPSEREREALYKYYIGENLKRIDPLYKLLNKWSKDDYRYHTNQSLKTFNTKKGHMEAVKIRVLSDKPKGWKKTADEIQADIETLTASFSKRVPG